MVISGCIVFRLNGLLLLSSFNFFFNFMCMGVFSACMSVHHVYSLCPRRPEEDIESLGTKTTNG